MRSFVLCTVAALTLGCSGDDVPPADQVSIPVDTTAVVDSLYIWHFGPDSRYSDPDAVYGSVDPPTVERERLARIREIVREMEEEYGPLLGSSAAERELRNEPIYSVEIESRLVREDGRPILFDSNLTDIRIRNGQYRLTFVTGWSFDRGPLAFDLVCTESAAKSLLEIRPDPDETMLVAARIDAVHKPVFGHDAKVPADAFDEESSARDTYADVVLVATQTHWASGECVKIAYLGSNVWIRDFLGRPVAELYETRPLRILMPRIIQDQAR